MEPVIATNGLTKVYRTRLPKAKPIHALQGISIEVNKGEIFALLGLNGAGKTTLVKLLLDLVRPTSGAAFLFGEPVSSGKWKPRVGYLPELFQARKNLSARAVTRFLGELSGLKGHDLRKGVEEVLEQVGLEAVKSQKVATFSKGMVTRLGLAQALLHKPSLLFLDEPTEGLDPLGRKKIRALLIELRNSGVTVFLNSHLLSEVELIADRIGILHKGKLVAVGTLHDLMPRDERYQIEVASKPTPELQGQFLEQNGMWVGVVQGVENLERLLGNLRARGIPVVSVQPLRVTLEDVFTSYVKEDTDV